MAEPSPATETRRRLDPLIVAAVVLFLIMMVFITLFIVRMILQERNR